MFGYVFIFLAQLDVGSIGRKERKIYSQNGEDGVVEHICSVIQCNTRYYVEFGAQDCAECNSRYLRSRGWNGLVMDGDHENPLINLRREMITVSNIVDLFKKYKVPRKFDVLSVDVDGMDFYVLRKILCNQFSPSLIVVEYNAHIPSNSGAWITPLTSPPSRCIGSCNGMSIQAVRLLASAFNYTLVYAMSNGVNAILVRNDKLPTSFVHPSLKSLDRPNLYLRKRNKWKHAQKKWNEISPTHPLIVLCDVKSPNRMKRERRPRIPAVFP